MKKGTIVQFKPRANLALSAKYQQHKCEKKIDNDSLAAELISLVLETDPDQINLDAQEHLKTYANQYQNIDNLKGMMLFLGLWLKTHYNSEAGKAFQACARRTNVIHFFQTHVFKEYNPHLGDMPERLMFSYWESLHDAIDEASKLYANEEVPIGKNHHFLHLINLYKNLINQTNQQYLELVNKVQNKIQHNNHLNPLDTLVKSKLWGNSYSLVSAKANYAFILAYHQDAQADLLLNDAKADFDDLMKISDELIILSGIDSKQAKENLSGLENSIQKEMDKHKQPRTPIELFFHTAYQQLKIFEQDFNTMLTKISENLILNSLPSSNESDFAQLKEKLIYDIEVVKSNEHKYDSLMGQDFFILLTKTHWDPTKELLLNLPLPLTKDQALEVLSLCTDIGKQWQIHFNSEQPNTIQKLLIEKFQHIAQNIASMKKIIANMPMMGEKVDKPIVELNLDEITGKFKALSLKGHESEKFNNISKEFLKAALLLEPGTMNENMQALLEKHQSQFQDKSFTQSIILCFIAHLTTFNFESKLKPSTAKDELSLLSLNINVLHFFRYHFVAKCNSEQLDDLPVILLHMLWVKVCEAQQKAYTLFYKNELPLSSHFSVYQDILSVQKVIAQILPEYQKIITPMLEDKDCHLHQDIQKQIKKAFWDTHHNFVSIQYNEAYFQTLHGNSKAKETIQTAKKVLEDLTENVSKIMTICNGDEILSKQELQLWKVQINSLADALEKNILVRYIALQQIFVTLTEFEKSFNLILGSIGSSSENETFPSILEEFNKQLVAIEKLSPSTDQFQEEAFNQLMQTHTLLLGLDRNFSKTQALNILLQAVNLCNKWKTFFNIEKPNEIRRLIVEKVNQIINNLLQKRKDILTIKESISIEEKPIITPKEQPKIIPQKKTAKSTKQKPSEIKPVETKKPLPKPESKSENTTGNKTKKDKSKPSTQKKKVVNPQVKKPKDPLLDDKEFVVPGRSMKVPDEAKLLLEKLNQHGYRAHIGGGYVRDKLLKIDFNDIDIYTDAPFDKVQSLIPECAQHLLDKNKFSIEKLKIDITCTPLTLKEDAAQRDYTINALYLNRKGQIVDPKKVIGDIDSSVKELISLHPEDELFATDRRRILRTVRLYNHIKKIKGIPLAYQEAMRLSAPLLINEGLSYYRKDLTVLFNRGQAEENCQTFFEFDLITHVVFVHPKQQQYQQALSEPLKNFMLKKCKEMDENVSFYAIVALLLLPLGEEGIEEFCNNYKGFAEHADKICLQIQVCKWLKEYQAEFLKSQEMIKKAEEEQLAMEVVQKQMAKLSINSPEFVPFAQQLAPVLPHINHKPGYFNQFRNTVSIVKESIAPKKKKKQYEYVRRVTQNATLGDYIVSNKKQIDYKK